MWSKSTELSFIPMKMVKWLRSSNHRMTRELLTVLPILAPDTPSHVFEEVSHLQVGIVEMEKGADVAWVGTTYPVATQLGQPECICGYCFPQIPIPVCVGRQG